MMLFRIQNAPTDAKTWFIQWKNSAGDWNELDNTRTNAKWEAMQFLQVCTAVATVFANPH